jgi:hypothetical protein
MLFSDRRIIIFVGGYGSGKTEVAVNYAFTSRAMVQNLSIVDLDVVNPYFRSRERIAQFARQDIHVIAPEGELATADLPALPPAIDGAIDNPERFVVFDVGGDDVGARALGRYHRKLSVADYEMWLVVNACRPFSQTAARTASLLRSIEKTSRLKATGLVNNTNLMQYTTVALLQRGEAMVQELGQQTGLPVIFNAVAEGLTEPAKEALKSPLLPLRLYMKRPWE